MAATRQETSSDEGVCLAADTLEEERRGLGQFWPWRAVARWIELLDRAGYSHREPLGSLPSGCNSRPARVST